MQRTGRCLRRAVPAARVITAALEKHYKDFQRALAENVIAVAGGVVLGVQVEAAITRPTAGMLYRVGPSMSSASSERRRCCWRRP
jgi:hypothetical protein